MKFGKGYNRITPLEIKTIRAVAHAHHETKAPIHSHTESGTMALEQMEILREEGVDLSCVSFGHMDRNPDPYYHEQVPRPGRFSALTGSARSNTGRRACGSIAFCRWWKRGMRTRF